MAFNSAPFNSGFNSVSEVTTVTTLSNVTLSNRQDWTSIAVTALPDFLETASYAEEAIAGLSFTAIVGDTLAFSDSVDLTVDSLTVPFISPPATKTGLYKFWSVSGQTWTAEAGYTWADDAFLQADSGSYSYTGTNANLNFDVAGGFTVVGDSGAYSYAGADAQVISSRILVSASGSYAYTGTVLDLKVPGFGIVANSGSYIYTGTDIGFIELRRISVDSGTYVYNGDDANLVFASDKRIGDGIAVTSSFGAGIVVKGDL